MRVDLQYQQKFQGLSGLGLSGSPGSPASQRREGMDVVQVQSERRGLDEKEGVRM